MWLQDKFPDVSDLPLFAEAEREPSRDISNTKKHFSDRVHDCLWEWHVSCPSCWQYTETNPCSHCGTLISALWEAFEVDSYDLHEYEADSNSDKLREDQEKQKVHINGVDTFIWWAKTQKNFLSCYMQFWWKTYRVLISPHLKKRVSKIYSNGKRMYVSNADFSLIATVASHICKNPDKYKLSHLKVFKQ